MRNSVQAQDFDSGEPGCVRAGRTWGTDATPFAIASDKNFGKKWRASRTSSDLWDRSRHSAEAVPVGEWEVRQPLDRLAVDEVFSI